MHYDKSIEAKWQQAWLKENAYKFVPESGKPIYTIDTPPPYTSGTLHMGHVLDFSFIDFLARYKRMKGFNVYYPQGWDTMGFPTERAVEKLYGKGLGSEEFVKKGIELATENLTAMRSQMLRLGFSLDLSLEYITMSNEYQAKVQLSLLEMYDKGFVYRGVHAVYWCPYCRSAIAKEETEEIEEKTKLNYILFDIVGSDEKLEIATTRPEYLHACVAVAVNPQGRHAQLAGKESKVPIFGNVVKIIADQSVKLEYGSGSEMVCTFGDKDDLILYHRHKLGNIKAIDESGRLINAGKYSGLGIKDARSAIIGVLKEEKRLIRQEEILHQVKIHDRCNNNVELIESMQWFIKTVEHAGKIKELAQQIEWIPKFTQRYLLDWAEYVDWDWVISRSRKFDTPLPFWYCGQCNEILPAKKVGLPINPKIAKAPVEKCPKCGGSVVPEELTCDVWIDSSITPLVIAGWPDSDPKRLSEHLPADIRVHATEIIRSWTFYTILRTWALTGDIPFRRVLIHGLLLGPDGKKMSKSLGNIVSPEALLSKFSADSVRMWSAMSGIIGKNKAFVFNDVKYAYDFINKLFNSYAFMERFISEDSTNGNAQPGIFDKGIISRLNRLIGDVDKAYEYFEYSAAANSMIDFYWHEFCDFYLENIKHIAYGQASPGRNAVLQTLREVITKMLLLLAPIMPFATEELYTKLLKKSVHRELFPVHDAKAIDVNAEEEAAYLNGIIAAIRRAKTAERLALNYELTRIIINLPDEYYSLVDREKGEIARICKAKEVVLKKAEVLSSEIVR